MQANAKFCNSCGAVQQAPTTTIVSAPPLPFRLHASLSTLR
jgi:hypothetical protein